MIKFPVDEQTGLASSDDIRCIGGADIDAVTDRDGRIEYLLSLVVVGRDDWFSLCLW